MNWLFDLSPDDRDALWLTLKIATLATCATLPFAVAVAYLLARKRFWGHAFVNGLVHLPLVLPPVVTGYLLLLGFGRQGIIGHYLDQCCSIVLSFRWTGAALAAGIMAFPLMVRAIRLSIEHVDQRLEGAAATLGAPRWAILITITLPLALPGILAGAILGFAKALGEFGATITFVSNIPGQSRTIAASIYSHTQVPGGDGAALQLSVIAIGISMLALLLSEWLAQRIHKTRSGVTP